ncbi:MAG: DUF6516 family protein [Sulfuritalea sp.]|nr:DUF6516 family protein [Sulfuritalea sp.]
MSDPIRERLDSLRARLILSSVVVSFHYHQEETVGDVGYFRVRCTLIDDSELQLIERFSAAADALAVDKYSFHWQRSDGAPICRWDNAPHHRDVATFPHHLHEGGTDVVQAHAPVDVFAVLDEIEQRLSVA